MEPPKEIILSQDAEKTRKLARKTFGRLLNENHWMRDPDGFDHCRKCFENYLSLFDDTRRKTILEDSERTAQFIQDAPRTLRSSDGWYAHCEGPGGREENGKEKWCPDNASVSVLDDSSAVAINGLE